MFICIAGKNICSINAIIILIKKKISKKRIYILPNSADNGRDSWQPSLKKYALNNNLNIVTMSKLYKIKKLIFFSIEYEKIIDVDKFNVNQDTEFDLNFNLEFATNKFSLDDSRLIVPPTSTKVWSGMSFLPMKSSTGRIRKSYRNPQPN